jgi:hypothetical protein
MEKPRNPHLEAYLKAVKTIVKRYHESLREEERLDRINFGEQSCSDHTLPQQQEVS